MFNFKSSTKNPNIMKNLVVCFTALLGSLTLFALPCKSGIIQHVHPIQDKIEIEEEDLPLAVSEAIVFRAGRGPSVAPWA